MTDGSASAERSSWLQLDKQFCFPIYAASNLIQRVYRPLLEPLGLTYPQYLVMMVLWEEDGVPVKELSRRLLLESGTLSPLLRRLQSQRLVKKASDAGDRRRVRITLTAKGRALRTQAEAVPQALVCRLLQQGGAAAGARVEGLREQMQQLVAGLDLALREAAPDAA